MRGSLPSRPNWQTIPEGGPIAAEIHSRRDWLEALQAGSAGARRKALQDLADDGRTEDRIRQSYTGRAAIELLQNAHDAMIDSGTSGHVRFVITDTAVIVANEGRPFDAERIESLTRLGSSAKAVSRGKHHQIGYKGIGFTSVFEITDRPQVMSQDVGLAFDRSEASATIEEYLGIGLDGPAPARYFPLPIAEGELGADESLIQSLFDEGAASVIRLPLRADRDRDVVLQTVRETLVPETLLFMPVIAGLSLDDQGTRSTWTRHEATRTGIGRIIHLVGERSRSSWLVATEQWEIDRALIDRLDDPLWSGVSRLNAGVAIPWGDRGPRQKYASRRIHSYFPTDDRLGRSLVLHADFYLDSSRRRLELKGPGGAVTRAASDAVADLAARLVASVGQWGQPLLRACTTFGTADEAGEMLGEKLEAALGRQEIIRTVGGGPLRRPSETVRLALDIEERHAARLATVLDPSLDLVDTSDDQGAVRDLLDRLGSKPLLPKQLAGRIDLSRSREPYATALGLLKEWLDALPYAYSAIEALADRPVVQDRNKRWTSPDAVERRAATAPELPTALRRAELREPQSTAARAFIDLLDIAALDPATALARLLDAVEVEEFGRTNDERLEALDLAFRIWRADPSSLRGESDRVGLLEVRARTPRARVERFWRSAADTYFGFDWSTDRTLEHLYSALGEPEFLAEPVPTSIVERKRRRAFFEALGVSSVPRRVQINAESTNQFWEWKGGEDRETAWKCSSGHPYATREIQGWVMDRLDDVLGHADDGETAIALAHGLVLLGEPYGPEATVQCRHGAHGGGAPTKKVVGYQRWRLTETPWVPVANDPSGAEVQVPERAWRGLPARSPWLMVPRAKLRPADAEALDLVPSERPHPAAVEAALRALAKAHPNLMEAPGEVRDTADWLVRRLERVLTRGERRNASSPPLPALGLDGWSWSRSAVVPNVPGVPRIRGLEMLPAGRWSGLQRSYGLSVARDLVTAEFRKGPIRRDVAPFLPTANRVYLLALLLRRGAESERTAARLVSLREQVVAWLTLGWRVTDETTMVPDARFLLEPIRDKRRRVTGGTLYWIADRRPGAVDLARSLAEYLELPDDDAEIALFIQDPAVLVAERGLTEGELRDADQLLRSRRRYREDPAPISGSESERPEPDERLDPAAWEEPSGGDEQDRLSPDSPVKEYIDPTAISFGLPVRVEAPERTAPADRKDPGSRTAPGSPARELTRPLAPASKEARAAASGRRTEQTAIAIVARFGRGLPTVAQVIDVQDEDRGWDLEFRMRDGTTVPVEVKGTSGSGPFVITANEWDAAKTYPEFTLYQVVDLTSPETTRIRVFRNLGGRLKEDQVAAAGWLVSRWQDLEPDEIPVRQSGRKRRGSS